MKTVVPIKSPGLLLQRLDTDHFYAVNCSFPNSLRILNRAQYDVLSAVDNQLSTSELCDKLAIQADTLNGLLGLLSKTEIIRFDDQFSKPEKPTTPKSLNFWIHTTNKCNLSCSYCYISTLNTTSGMADDTKKQLLSKLVETVSNRKINHIKFRLAGGEPLSQFKSWKGFIPQAKRTLKELGCDLEISFITNLTILNDEILAFSKENNISYGVSMDGVETYNDATRTYRSGAGTFKTIDGNIRKLLAHGIPFSINTVVNNGNLQGLPQLTRYLIDLDVPFRYSIVKGEDIEAERLGQISG